jgi:hypothetical protein
MIVMKVKEKEKVMVVLECADIFFFDLIWFIWGDLFLVVR